MKKFLLLIPVSIILLLIINFPVFASSNTYNLDELGLQVTFPSDYSVITRDTPASDTVFDDLSTTRSEIMNHFNSNHIYLDAISNTYNEEIVVTMMENDISNLSSFSETILNTFATTMVNEYKNYGINVLKYEIYDHSQAKFIVTYFTDTANTVHGLQYYTIYDGKAINFTMRSYEGSLSSRQEAAIKNIVDSIKYDTPPIFTEEGKDTDSSVYTDEDSGATFTIPANWEQKEFTKDREYIDAKFVSTKDEGCTIIYSSTDAWNELFDFEKIGHTRSDLNNSAFEKSDVAEIYEIPEEDVTTVTYNGIEYFKIESTYTSSEYEIDITATATQLIYIENGWMYSFQFMGTSTHKLYSDFESLVKSVEYPIVTDVSNTISSVDTAIATDSNSDTKILTVLIIIVAIIVITTVLRKRTKNRDDLYIYCKNCGQMSPSDSEICSKCGNRINKE